jgi:hypothetical protein
MGLQILYSGWENGFLKRLQQFIPESLYLAGMHRD